MKVCIRREPNGSIYIDKTALERFDEKILTEPPYNYSFVDVEKEDCDASDFNDDLTFNINKYNKRKNKYILEKELSELHDWLDNYYDNQVKQYNRCLRLNQPYDKDINELDNQAKSYQERIREIKDLLKQEK